MGALTRLSQPLPPNESNEKSSESWGADLQWGPCCGGWQPQGRLILTAAAPARGWEVAILGARSGVVERGDSSGGGGGRRQHGQRKASYHQRLTGDGSYEDSDDGTEGRTRGWGGSARRHARPRPCEETVPPAQRDRSGKDSGDDEAGVYPEGPYLFLYPSTPPIPETQGSWSPRPLRGTATSATTAADVRRVVRAAWLATPRRQRGVGRRR